MKILAVHYIGDKHGQPQVPSFGLCIDHDLLQVRNLAPKESQ